MFLYGASGHAKVIIDILKLNRIEIKGLFDDNPTIRELIGIPCFGPYTSQNIDDLMIISIGDNKLRKKVSERFNFSYGKAIHPSAIISADIKINDGTVIMGNTIINSDSIIGKHVIINTSASIDHDCIIGDYVHISPNATLCGGVTIGEGTHFGAAAVAIPNIKIGKWATIGAGAVVIRDVPDFAVVVGNPAKVIKYNKNE
jgi:acetyltransferase EpsM